jgi:divalent metal cation (Fe/Co/Zn/Cd) transporter
LKVIAVSFFALAAWIGFDSVRHLLGGEIAEPSPVGIGIAAVSVVVMPLLVWAKRRTGRELGSATVVADSVQTLLCTYLSAVLLIGLGLNAVLGWSWADPIAALAIAGVAVKEGIEAWRGDHCDDCAIRSPAGGCQDDRSTDGRARP